MLLNQAITINHNDRNISVIFSSRAAENSISVQAHGITYRGKVNYLEVKFAIPISENYFSKMVYRKQLDRTFDSLKPPIRWQSQVLTYVLRFECIEIINRLLSYYKIAYDQFGIPDCTITHIVCDFFFIKRGTETYAIMGKSYQSPEQTDADNTTNMSNSFQEIISSHKGARKLNHPLFNLLHLMEMGQYDQVIAGCINFLHSYLEDLIRQCVNNKSLIAEMDGIDRSHLYDSTMLISWMFELVTGRSLKDFLAEKNKDELYKKYKSLRKTRNDVSHPKLRKNGYASFFDALGALELIGQIIGLISISDERLVNGSVYYSLIEKYIYQLRKQYGLQTSALIPNYYTSLAKMML